ncbi:hypothetical protein MBLNU230_g7238t1 [Neophaeotheca triangularis]
MPSLKNILKPRSGSTSNNASDNEASPRRSVDKNSRASTGLSNLSNGHTSQSASKERTSTSRSSPRASREHHRPSVTQSPLGFMKRKVRSDSESHSSTEDLPLNREGATMSHNQQKKHERQVEKEQQRQMAEQKTEADRKRKQDMEERAKNEETEDMRSRYGRLPINIYAGEVTNEPRLDLRDLTEDHLNKSVVFRARIHNMRKVSAHLMFVELRQQTMTVQGVLQEHAGVSPFMLYWAEHLHVETIVRVRGVVQEPKTQPGEVKSVSIHKLEIHIHEMHAEAEPTETLPFTVHEAEVTKEETDKEGDNRHRVPDKARHNNRIVALRTTTDQGIFRIQSGICQAFRAHLDKIGFIEIHTPKLQAAATESGASVFKVDYFGRPAFLAQSPQLAKQMCVAADFRRVMEVGAVFRAENSNTHRHMTEYTGLDVEMAIEEHYHEVLNVLISTFKTIFRYIYDNYRPEIEVVKRQFPHEDLLWLEETPIIPFAEGIRMLNESGWRDDEGKELGENEDLGTRDEIELGKVIRKRYNTDFYVLDKFPTAARPFYAMKDPNDPSVTNSFDIFLRGQEIVSGGQRVHDAKVLMQQMEKMKMDPKAMDDYMSGFEWGAPPHGGGGIGLERLLMLMLQLGDIRNATLFPRDPKSLPYKPPVKQLRHPEASTLSPPWAGQDRAAAGIEFQPLEKLIANYGDASNTSWLEPKFEIWRDHNTGAAIGFVPHEGFAITIGDPLCHQSQYVKVITGYLRYVKKERHLKPLWLLCGPDTEQALADKHDWRTFSVAAEQRINPQKTSNDHEVQRKVRHAEKEGVKMHDIPIGTPVPDDIKKQVDKRVQEWLANRKGKQVHLTDVHPWQDEPHRQYHYATASDGSISTLIIMAQLSPDHGWQVKFGLDFPGAPSGAIEMSIIHALKSIAAAGAESCTFGGGASSKLTPGHNLKGSRVKVLGKAYHAIANDLHLINKSEFREKLGAFEDPIYVCYPPHGLGPGGVRAILSFFQDDDASGKV